MLFAATGGLTVFMHRNIDLFSHSFVYSESYFDRLELTMLCRTSCRGWCSEGSGSGRRTGRFGKVSPRNPAPHSLTRYLILSRNKVVAAPADGEAHAEQESRWEKPVTVVPAGDHVVVAAAITRRDFQGTSDPSCHSNLSLVVSSEKRNYF